MSNAHLEDVCSIVLLPSDMSSCETCHYLSLGLLGLGPLRLTLLQDVLDMASLAGLVTLQTLRGAWDGVSSAHMLVFHGFGLCVHLGLQHLLKSA